MEAEEMSASKASNGSIQALRQAKIALRKEMARILDDLETSTIVSQSAKVTSHILEHSAFQKADKISIYVSMDKGEVRTETLCKETLKLGKRLYVPRFASAVNMSSDVKKGQDLKFDSDMRMLRIHDWKDFEAMVMNKWGIREPADMSDTVNREDALEEASGGDGLDLILAPGVAFDRFGGRLGHGKGYYDRYIERCNVFQQRKKRPGPVVVALALDEQILQEQQRVPADERDCILNDIITSKGSLLQRPEEVSQLQQNHTKEKKIFDKAFIATLRFLTLLKREATISLCHLLLVKSIGLTMTELKKCAKIKGNIVM